MDLYTVQLGKWRKCKEQGIELVNTTVKNGSAVFAPTWPMVTGIKKMTGAKPLDEEEYTVLYLDHMRESFRDNKEEWLKLFEHEKVAIACMCPEGKFCHRLLLVDCFKAIALKYKLNFNYCGEVQ